MAEYMLFLGQIENWIMFINLEKTSLLSMPDAIKKLIQTLSDYFIARIYRSYILGISGILRFFLSLCVVF